VANPKASFTPGDTLPYGAMRQAAPRGNGRTVPHGIAIERTEPGVKEQWS